MGHLSKVAYTGEGMINQFSLDFIQVTLSVFAFNILSKMTETWKI